MNSLARRFITDDEAVPTRTQHRKPCADCPFARTAIPGWLGKPSKEHWLAYAHGEARIYCHSTGNQQCAGTAIFRANVFKEPKNKDLLRLNSNPTLVFATDEEFLEHHSQPPNFQKS